MAGSGGDQGWPCGQVMSTSGGLLCRVCYPLGGRQVDDLHGDQGDAEVADFGEQAVQLRLVRDGTGEAGRAVVLAGQGEVTEPGRPVLVEVPVDPEPVAGGGLLVWRSGS